VEEKLETEKVLVGKSKKKNIISLDKFVTFISILCNFVLLNFITIFSRRIGDMILWLVII